MKHLTNLQYVELTGLKMTPKEIKIHFFVVRDKARGWWTISERINKGGFDKIVDWLVEQQKLGLLVKGCRILAITQDVVQGKRHDYTIHMSKMPLIVESGSAKLRPETEKAIVAELQWFNKHSGGKEPIERLVHAKSSFDNIERIVVEQLQQRQKMDMFDRVQRVQAQIVEDLLGERDVCCNTKTS